MALSLLSLRIMADVDPSLLRTAAYEAGTKVFSFDYLIPYNTSTFLANIFFNLLNECSIRQPKDKSQVGMKTS